jgi:hypothetical protein
MEVFKMTHNDKVKKLIEISCSFINQTSYLMVLIFDNQTNQVIVRIASSEKEAAELADGREYLTKRS